jgi:hypothetical protein
MGVLRPPYLWGAEDLYWSHGPLMRLRDRDWRRIIYDHLWARRTQGSRTYTSDETTRAMIAEALAAQDGLVSGLGSRHQLGFWVADGE